MADDSVSLRSLAERRGMHVGAAVSARPLREDAAYRDTLAREFNMLTPENALKFGPLRPTRDSFDFGEADALVSFAHEHAMAVRGHTLVWHNQLPEWAGQIPPERDAWLDVLRDHIHTVTKRYRGKIAAWDVVNEGIGDDCVLRGSVFHRVFGADYITMVFKWAHEGDPGAKLFYNDYSADAWGRKSSAVYALAKDLVERGVPIHGVGLQMHLCLWAPPSPCLVAANISRLNKLGLDVQITEMDVRIREPITDEDLARQARVYRDIMRVCVKAKNCKVLTTWGVTDKYSWVPHFFKGTSAPLLFDEAGRPKPAYYALCDALAEGLS